MRVVIIFASGWHVLSGRARIAVPSKEAGMEDVSMAFASFLLSGKWKQHRKLAGLMVIWLMLIAIAVPVWQVTIGFDALAMLNRVYQKGRVPVLLWWAARSDPSVGTQMKAPSKENIVKGQLSKGAFKGVLFVGQVSPCTLRGLEGYRVMQEGLRKRLQFIVVYMDGQIPLAQLIHDAQWKGFVWVKDSSGDYAKHWNAYFVPRLYLVDGQWRLKYAQLHSEGNQAALLKCVQQVLEEVR